ncbi:hypothetical protein ACJTM1_18795 [Bacillus sp. GX]|uniref:hypothetical protein n=1 Tax=Bacillus TaxID=1386 RepID=UPI00142EB4F7|nr:MULTISPECIES: hypothetical protein [Bacillus]UPL46758.1 hypothetical protein MU858_12790 [Bacillus sp. PGP15]WPU77740.1 hypothetical protein SNE23_12760 [Bacillus sp. RA(2023)]
MVQICLMCGKEAYDPSNEEVDVVFCDKCMGAAVESVGEEPLRKMVPMASYGWNKEKQCVEFQLLINEEIYVMPVYEKA